MGFYPDDQGQGVPDRPEIRPDPGLSVTDGFRFGFGFMLGATVFGITIVVLAGLIVAAFAAVGLRH